jgi:hypothetical protein
LNDNKIETKVVHDQLCSVAERYPLSSHHSNICVIFTVYIARFCRNGEGEHIMTRKVMIFGTIGQFNISYPVVLIAERNFLLPHAIFEQ